MDLSCAFAPSMDTPDHVALAEQLGYRRAWLYDSPALYPDVWMSLARAADRTSTIGLGPAVLVPSLRHPMVNAAAIATLAAQAPGRTAVAVGSGFTGRMVLGQRPMRWSDVADYVRALRGLLRGEDVEWDGKVLRMLQLPDFGHERPIDVPILIGAGGPKGLEVARDLGDGIFSAGALQAAESPWHALLVFGTVVDDGEDVSSPRVLAAAGPGLVVALHGTWEWAGPEAVDGFPGGKAWRTAIEAEPAESRYLAVHEGHLVALNDRDQAAIGELSSLLTAFGISGTAAEVRAKADGFAAAGVTELVFQPSGPDIRRELEAMMEALG
ncbi:MAG TPA: LLM class flavin-dependent oxidoreductase [Acidimicrobiales bacterium]